MVCKYCHSFVTKCMGMVNSTMRAFLKNMSHPAFGPKGEGARRAKNRRRDLRLWNPVPAIINPSWVAKLDHCLKPTAVGDLRRLIISCFFSKAEVAGQKEVWNHSETPAAHHLQRSLSLSSPSSSLCLSLSLSLSFSVCFLSVSRAILFSGPLHGLSGP